jgi:PPOX class probable F420-dependent enzyme
MDAVLPDPTTPFGARVAQRLRDDPVIWLTTVAADGTPQPNPVWFLWDGQSVLVYNQPRARRLVHVHRHPQVALHFDSNGRGGDIVVITGKAHLSPDEPRADQVPGYVDKYRDLIARIGHDPASMAAAYSVALRITPARVRGF